MDTQLEPTPYPVVPRSDAPLAVLCTWRVHHPAEQRRVAAATVTGWGEGLPPGCLSRTCLVSTDGAAVAHYSQWRSEQAWRAVTPAECAPVDWAVAQAPVAYQLYRSEVEKPDHTAATGCVVLVEVTFEEPNVARARAWVDAMLDGPAGGEPPLRGADPGADEEPAVPGLLAAHFHTSIAGDRVLNYAEWRDEADHRRWAGDAPVHPAPGVTMRRYLRYAGASAPVVP